MRVLVLGGTGFVGRAVVEAALARGDRATAFNRGTRPPAEGAEARVGDRREDLAALDDGTWDVVVDTWSAEPVVVRQSAEALRGRVGSYVYVSTRSVYDEPPAGADETAPLVQGDPQDTEHDDYARAKRGAELAVLEVFGEDALLPRPGLILGPHEDVGRLPWWLGRFARGGTIPVPGPPDVQLQYVDARDLATWTLEAADKGLTGPYDVVSPPGFTTTGALFEAVAAATDSHADLRWVTPEQVERAGVEPWTELPIWLPPGPDRDNLFHSDVARAVAAGLRCRPVTDTVVDTWEWMRGLGGEVPLRPDRPRVGLTPEAERRLLEAAGEP